MEIQNEEFYFSDHRITRNPKPIINNPADMKPMPTFRLRESIAAPVTIDAIPITTTITMAMT